jgi:hypothetical protein
MTELVDDIHRSSNGDRWRLVRETSSGRQFVRHEPNPSSGGRVTDTAVDEFLSVDGSGPEYAALRRLLERPLESGDRARPAEPGGMKKAHPHAGAAYRVMPLSGGTFGVEVVIPDTDPTMVSGFATEAAAQAWVATHKKQASDKLSPTQRWRQSRGGASRL